MKNTVTPIRYLPPPAALRRTELLGALLVSGCLLTTAARADLTYSVSETIPSTAFENQLTIAGDNNPVITLTGSTILTGTDLTAIRIGTDGQSGSLIVQNASKVELSNAAQPTSQINMWIGTGAGNTGSLRVTGSNSTLSYAAAANSNFTLTVGGSLAEGTANGTGKLDILNAGTVKGFGYALIQGGGTGQISGSNSSLQVRNGVSVTDGGLLTINSGGQVSVAGNFGTSTIGNGGKLVASGRVGTSGRQSTYGVHSLRVEGTNGGTSAIGEVEISGGARVSAVDAIIGGKVTVSGADSRWATNLDKLTMSEGARVLVSNGGTLDSRNYNPSQQNPTIYNTHTTTLATRYTDDVEVTVTGANSLWQVSSVDIGEYGSATVNIENGGKLEAAFGARVGAEGSGINPEGGRGLVNISGASSEMSVAKDLVLGTWGGTYYTDEDGNLGVGVIHAGTGTVNIADGGRLTVGGVITIHEGSAINLEEGGILSADAIVATIDPRDSYLLGELNLNGGTLETGEVTFRDPRSGNFVIYANVSNSSRLTPGNSPGRIHVVGDFTQNSDGELIMEIGGTEAGEEYDVLSTTGIFTAGGIFEIQSYADFVPAENDIFQLLEFASAQGEFDEIIAFDLGEGLVWDFSRLLVDGTVSVANAIPEPATYAAILSLLAIGIAARTRRRNRVN